jgi:prephenate dehydrogenase
VNTASLRIGTLCIVGVGLIGGSLARALRRAGVCNDIVGVSRRAEHLQCAVDLGVIDRFSTDVHDVAGDADVILLASPIGAMEAVLTQLKPVISKRCIITDAGSAKHSVLAAAERVFGVMPPRFVAAHPIAGTEKSGVEASFAELYEGRRVIITPHPNNDADAVATITQMWRAVGAEVLAMDAQQHDRVLAATSHLPHVLAFGLVDALARMSCSDDIFRYAAGGFRDFTRIASSDPVMWRDICLGNAASILQVISEFQSELTDLSALIQRGDGAMLETVFQRAKSARDHYMKQFEPKRSEG